MSDDPTPDWIWLSNGAIDAFKQWRIESGTTAASASSYATGARRFVRHCRSIGAAPASGLDSFRQHLDTAQDLSERARSDYRSHARAFVTFLGDRGPARSRPPGSGPQRDASATPAAPPAELSPWLESFAGMSTPDLLAGYARTLELLRGRGVLRTANAPAGDYAEWLVWRAFGGRIEPNSTKSHDITDAAGRRLQVKARLVSARPNPGQLQTSVFRSWDFDFAVLVQLDEHDYTVSRASMVPANLFDGGNANARWSDHVKGWAVFMTPALMQHAASVDVTSELRAAAEAG